MGYTKFVMPIRHPREYQVDSQICESKIREVHTGNINWKASLMNSGWSHET